MNYQLYTTFAIPFILVGTITFTNKNKNYTNSEAEYLKSLIWSIR